MALSKLVPKSGKSGSGRTSCLGIGDGASSTSSLACVAELGLEVLAEPGLEAAELGLEAGMRPGLDATAELGREAGVAELGLDATVEVELERPMRSA